MIPSTECSNDDDDDNNNNNNKNKEERGQLLNDNDQGEEDTDAVDDNDDKDNDTDNASLLIKDHLSKIAEEEDGDVDDDDDNDDGDNENTGFIVSSKKKNTKKKKKKKLNQKNKNNTQRGNRNRNNNSNNKNNDNTNASTLHTKSADESSGERKTGHFLSFFTTHDTNTLNNICYKTLFPDNKGIYVCGYPLLDHKNDLTTNQDDHHHQDQDPTTNNIPIKLLKFILLTFVMIGMVHVIVAALFNDRDRALTLRHIWVFEGDLIVRDCLVFFVVGRLYHPQSMGIDHLAWMGTALWDACIIPRPGALIISPGWAPLSWPICILKVKILSDSYNIRCPCMKYIVSGRGNYGCLPSC